jgi:putative PIN family toxin of toxin-antitoxin system
LIRIVADTNVYISGTFWPGLNRLVLNLARHKVLSLACSSTVLQELALTLKGKKFNLSDSQIDILVGDILTYTLPVHEPPFSHPELRDPKDNFVCSLAVKGRASYLVTGDKDLLVLRHVKKTRILTAREFLETEFPQLLEAYEEGLESGHDQ